MRFSGLGAGAALTVIVVVAGCSARDQAGRPERTASTSQAIQNGATDSTHTFAVGLCGGQKGYCSAICSGTLILPNLVVTARHCVDESPKKPLCTNTPAPSFGPREYGPGGRSGALWVTTNTEMLASTGGSTTTGWHSVKKIFTPGDSHVCGNDIALLVLGDVIPANEAVPIAPGVQYPMNDPKYSSRFTAIGYGNTAPAGDGSGTRRIKNRIPVLCIPGDEYMDCPAEAKVDPNEFIGGDGTCPGDSGSGAFEDSSFGTTQTLSFGVLSRGGVSEDGAKCEVSIYTRLDKWRDLVIQAAADASNNWTSYKKPKPDWTVYVPPPVRDAGAEASTPTTEPSARGFGEPCSDPSECSSKHCIDPGGGNLFCSESCADSPSCPAGYDCSGDGLCVPAPPAAPKTTRTTTESCAMAADPQPTPWRWVGVVPLVLALARRRRRR